MIYSSDTGTLTRFVHNNNTYVCTVETIYNDTISSHISDLIIYTIKGPFLTGYNDICLVDEFRQID